MKKRLETEQAPKAIGPYSQGILVSSSSPLIFVSGQLPVDPQTGKMIPGDIQTLTRQVITNIKAILLEADSDLDCVVRTDVFLKNMSDFAAMNEEYGRHFTGPAFPARQTIQVAELPLGALLEISCIAKIR